MPTASNEYKTSVPLKPNLSRNQEAVFVKSVARPRELNDAIATADALFSLGLREAQIIGSALPEHNRPPFAAGICAAVLQFVWKNRQKSSAQNWELCWESLPVPR